jgi:hypothetical protein
VNEGYLGQDTLPYGKTVTVDTSLGQLIVDTSCLPRAPGGGAGRVSRKRSVPASGAGRGR